MNPIYETELIAWNLKMSSEKHSSFQIQIHQFFWLTMPYMCFCRIHFWPFVLRYVVSHPLLRRLLHTEAE